MNIFIADISNWSVFFLSFINRNVTLRNFSLASKFVPPKVEKNPELFT